MPAGSASRASSPSGWTAAYPAGRTGAWIKSKCSDRQEFVIAGYVPSTADASSSARWCSASSATASSPTSAGSAPASAARVARDARGAAGAARAQDRAFRREACRRRGAGRALGQARAGRRGRVPRLDRRRPAAPRRASAGCARTSRRARSCARRPAVETGAEPPAQVRLTHPDRVYWPDAGVTKQGLADYYAEAWPRMAPHLVNRPVALLRCPGGWKAQCFFQKHAWKGQAREILTFTDPEDDGDDPLVAVDGLPGLIGMVQGGALEIHTWQSTLADLEHPDQIVMDLDPGEGVVWEAYDRRGARGAGAAGGRGARRPSSRPPAARGCTWSRRSRPRGAGWDAVKGFAAEHGPGDGGRRAGALRRDHHQVEAQRADPDRLPAQRPQQHRRSSPTPPGRAPARRCRCRSPGTSSAPRSGRRISPSPTPRSGVAGSSDPWADFRAAAQPLPGDR